MIGRGWTAFQSTQHDAFQMGMGTVHLAAEAAGGIHGATTTTFGCHSVLLILRPERWQQQQNHQQNDGGAHDPSPVSSEHTGGIHRNIFQSFFFHLFLHSYRLLCVPSSGRHGPEVNVLCMCVCVELKAARNRLTAANPKTRVHAGSEGEMTR